MQVADQTPGSLVYHGREPRGQPTVYNHFSQDHPYW